MYTVLKLLQISAASALLYLWLWFPVYYIKGIIFPIDLMLFFLWSCFIFALLEVAAYGKIDIKSKAPDRGNYDFD